MDTPKTNMLLGVTVKAIIAISYHDCIFIAKVYNLFDRDRLSVGHRMRYTSKATLSR